MNTRKTYQAVLQDEMDGFYTISVVEDPATEVQFQLFDKQRELFSVQDEEKRIMFSVVMLADTPIYRRTPELGEFYVKFSKETLREMSKRCLQNGFQNNVSFSHDGTLVQGINMFEIFQSDKERGIDPKGFEDCADGTLFASFKVEDDELWDKIKNGNFKGFSFETVFALEESDFSKDNNEDEALMDEIITMLEKIKK